MVPRKGKQEIDYLIIGHVTRDIIEDGFRLGGTAVYSSILAQRMDLKVGLITSYEVNLPIDPLDGIQIINHQSKRTTTFNNIYTPSGRDQILLKRAKSLGTNLIPEGWQLAKIVHLGPVAQEVSLEIGRNFPGSAVGYSLQGWLRKWDREGLVIPSEFPRIEIPLGENSAGFLSRDDIGLNRSVLNQLRSLFPLLILTKGNAGAELIRQTEIVPIPVEPAEEVDPTGAGDIFAAAFMIFHFLIGKSALESAELASALAAISVTRPGIKGIPTREEIQSVQEVH